jgi:cytochrome P450
MSGWEPETVARLLGFEPQPVYRELQDTDPAKHMGGNVVRLLTMADILTVNKHKDVLGTGAMGPSMGGIRPLIPLDIDGAEHTKYRRILDPVFAPKRVALLEDRVRRRAGELIDEFAGRGETDLVQSFTVPLPTTIFLTIMGIPQSQLDYFIDFKDGILRSGFDQTLTPEQRAKAVSDASGRCYAFFDNELRERRQRGEPGDDLIGGLMTAEIDGHRLTDENIQDICYLLMIAGLDTITASLGCILSWLARHPDERRWVLEDASRWPLAIEELMRFESPVPGGSRFATAEVDINGRTYPAGTHFHISWSAANLDPAYFDDPLTVNLSRQPNPHIDFASGWHRCLGSHLARLELRIAMEEFHARIPDYGIKPGAEVPYLPLGVRQPLSLPVVWPAS